MSFRRLPRYNVLGFVQSPLLPSEYSAVNVKTAPLDPQKEIEQLRAEIARHDYLYYSQARPEISDLDYDRLFQRLRELERQHPELITLDSPTQRVGDVLTEGFRSVRSSLSADLTR